MTTFTKMILSGSSNGRPILLAATATPGTLLHTAHATNADEIWLYASNTSTTLAKLTVEFGGTLNPNDTIEVGIPAESGLVLVMPGVPVTGSVVVRAFADAASVVNIVGFVNRIAQ